MEHYDKVEKYARGKLSSEEKAVFEKRLETDEKLMEELTAYRKNELVIKAAARQKIRQEVSTAYVEKNKNYRIFTMHRMAIAASFLILLAAGLWWSNQNNKTPDKLYSEYFEIPAPPSVRNGNTAVNPKWKTAIDAYAENHFSTAIPIFEELLLDEDFNQKGTIKLLLGASFLKEEKYEEALYILNQINPSSTFIQDAEWYRALALLKMGNKKDAKKAFEHIVKQKRHFKKEEAEAVLMNWK